MGPGDNGFKEVESKVTNSTLAICGRVKHRMVRIKTTETYWPTYVKSVYVAYCSEPGYDPFFFKHDVGKDKVF